MSANINNYPQYPQQGNFGANPAMIPVADKAIENAQNSGAGNVMSDLPTTPDQFIKEAPYFATAAGISLGVKELVERSSGKTKRLEESFFYKNISENIDKTKFAQGIDSVINSVRGTLKKLPLPHIVSTEPEFALAKGFLHGAKGQAIDELVKGLKQLDSQVLKDANIEEKVIKEFNAIVNDVNLNEKAIYEKLKGLKIGDVRLLDKIPVEKLQVKLPAGKILGFIPGRIKTINLNLNYNKVKELEMEGGKTYLAKFLPKLKMLLGESVTGGVVGGGAVGILFNALFLGHSIKKSSEAPKGEKVSTFMEDFLGNMVGGFIFMPLMGRLYHKVAGIKYVGMAGGKEGIEDFKTGIKELKGRIFAHKKLNKLGNNAVDEKLIKQLAEKLKIDPSIIKNMKADEILNHLKIDGNALKKEAEVLKELYKGNASRFKKLLRLPGRILGVGLDKIPALTKGGKFKNVLKGFGGGALRFGVILFVLMPPVTKFFMKVSHFIFGKPTNSQLDIDKKAEEASKEKANPFDKPVSEQTAQNKVYQDFLNKSKTAQPVNQQNQTNNQSVRTQVPLDKSVSEQTAQNKIYQNFLNKLKSAQPVNQPNQTVNQSNQSVRTYVPQTTGVTVSSTSTVDKALAKSDRMMEHADKVLKDMGI